MSQIDKQFKLNVFVQISAFASSLAIGVLLTPRLVDLLGVDKYSLISVSGVLTQYMGAFGGSLGAAIVRYCCIDYHKLEINERSKNYSVAQTLIYFVSLIYIILALASIFYIKIFLQINDEDILEVYALVVALLISFVFGLNESIFTSVFSARGKIYLISLLSIFYNLLKFIIIWVFLESYNSLYFYAIVESSLSFFKFFLAFLFFKSLKTNIKFRLNWHLTFPSNGILSMTMWGVVAAIGFSLFRKTDLLLINNFISAEVAGYIAVVMVWSGLLVVIASQVTSFLTSYLTPVYAVDGIEKFNQSRVFFARIAAALSGSVVAIAVYYSPELLPMWVGNNEINDYLVPHYGFLIASSFILSQSVNMVTFSVLAKLKKFSLILCGFGTIYVFTCYVALSNGYGIETIAILNMAANFLLYQLIVSVLSSRYCKSRYDHMEIIIYLFFVMALYTLFGFSAVLFESLYLRIASSVVILITMSLCFLFLLIYVSQRKGVMPDVF